MSEVNWIVGDLSYEDMVGKAGHYIPKSVIPSWLRQANYHPVEVNGIPIDTIRKDKYAYMDPMKNGVLGETLVIKMVKFNLTLKKLIIIIFPILLLFVVMNDPL